jgi:hypothetical protein
MIVEMKPGRRSVVPYIIAAVIAVTFCRIIGSQKHPQPKPASAGVRPVARPEPARNPLVLELAVSPSIERKPGIAAVILVDVTGSMRDSVLAANGRKAPKIEIAKRAVLDLLAKSEAFIKANPATDFQLGVYEFSAIDGEPYVRKLVPIGPPDFGKARAAVNSMTANGATPIGDAIVTAKKDLDAVARTREHILVVTDGVNNRGYSPEDVVDVISRLGDDARASVYFVAFDVSADVFNGIKKKGGLVLAASNESELQQTLDYVLTGKILAEQTSGPGTAPVDSGDRQ